MTTLTHIDDKGAAHMVDISAKAATVREAVAAGRVTMSSEALAALQAGSLAKGDALAVARIAGIMAAKRTSELIPLCHPLTLSKVAVEISFEEDAVHVATTAMTSGQTGVEMEAMTATSVALLTLYDMAKSVDRSMVIRDVRLISKTGGKSGPWQRT